MAEGYKDWSAGDILTAADLEDYTVKQSVMVFADASARTSALSSVLREGMVSYLKDTDSTEVYDGSAWVAVGGGKILQVVQGTYGTAETTTSATYVDTSLTATITPSDASSKVLILCNASIYQYSVGTSTGNCHHAIERGGSQIYEHQTANVYNQNWSGTSRIRVNMSLSYLDSPATTSATTYTLQHRTTATVETFYNNQTGSLILMEVSA